jgi:hypothetical protein
MIARDFKRLNAYEKEWRRVHGEPQFPEAKRLNHPIPQPKVAAGS